MYHTHPRRRYPIFPPLFHKQENLTNKRNGTKLAKQRASMIFQISKILIYRLLRNAHSQLHHFYEILEIIHELEYQPYSAERRPTEKKCISYISEDIVLKHTSAKFDLVICKKRSK